MRRTSLWIRALHFLLAMLLAIPLQPMAQQGGGGATNKLSQQELAQLLAPIALYPDELVSQVLMASTYPLEVVQADRWVQGNKGLQGDALAKALEKESWDPSVKSLVNFPSVLSAMSQKLDLTTKLGDAFLSQQKEVMDTIQFLRKKAYDAGNLKTTKEQKVVVEKETIVIQPAQTQVVYVPSYSTTVVYGAWMYPAYPPYYYYPPPPPAYPAYHFAAGVAVGAAWGYAWGSCNWHGGDVDIDYNRNTTINNNIDRSKYQNRVNPNGRGTWQHDPSHRKNVAYRDNATAKQFGQSPSRSAESRREARGFGDAGGRGGAARPSAGTMDRGAGQRGGSAGASVSDRSSGQRTSTGSGRDSAFGGGSGSQERMASDRGTSSRQSAGLSSGSRGDSGFSRSSGGFGGGGRSFGGGGRGGRR
ncbi:DUF3300 domain-containing protein [Pelobacter propionicus]|uniref:DUF3300 domain-containing protein n=1 Tax=Pelobacter propionicus (strain DSM 2379 / NBRC 103807 / OttBd1) TaxID=338966 RepID=A1AL31_PELPD|nr:DUF3300 domain-containing protein [Pelobacter propionicus]ABK98051.1 conserved hypothetical protein [Pelobacter propionicus DSM 2379]